MKPKDRMFPTIGEHDQLQLRQVVSESYPQRRWNRDLAALERVRYSLTMGQYMSEADAKAQGSRPDHNKPCS